MHEPQSIVLKNHHLKVVSCISSLFGIHAMLCGKMAENFPHPVSPHLPRGNVAGVWEVGGRLKLLWEFKPERRHGSTRVPGHAFLA
jgi:hypothetical protein